MNIWFYAESMKELVKLKPLKSLIFKDCCFKDLYNTYNSYLIERAWPYSKSEGFRWHLLQEPEHLIARPLSWSNNIFLKKHNIKKILKNYQRYQSNVCMNKNYIKHMYWYNVIFKNKEYAIHRKKNYLSSNFSANYRSRVYFLFWHPLQHTNFSLLSK